MLNNCRAQSRSEQAAESLSSAQLAAGAIEAALLGLILAVNSLNGTEEAHLLRVTTFLLVEVAYVGLHLRWVPVGANCHLSLHPTANSANHCLKGLWLFA